jgi:6-phosphogluconate dehydrogenase
MNNTQPQQRYEIGMVGLGVMGRNFLLNMAGHGFSAAAYFESHTYDLIDAKGTFHTQWGGK